MKKRSCSSHGSDKSAEGHSSRSRKEKRFITFEYKHLTCFINHNAPPQCNSRQSKKERKLATLPSAPLNPSSSELSNPLAQLRIPRKNRGKLTSHSKNAFNNSLLLLEYEGEDQCRLESKPQNGQRSKQSPQSQEEDSEVVHVVNSCLRVITEDTEHSSNPISARYTPQSEPSPSLTMSMGLPMMTQYSVPEEYYYYMMKTPSVRNRRAISTEQSKAYVIDVDKVVLDGRTTIMIRNIPNKYTQEMLLELFQKNHKKKFDFFYLPIDYNNNCNVGYAFLNFIHTKFIVDFYKEFHKVRWNRFNSVKVCQVCYARIQGTAQLQHHFEHSNVLQQRQRRYRPLIGLRSFQDNITSIIQKQKDEHASENEEAEMI